MEGKEACTDWLTARWDREESFAKQLTWQVKQDAVSEKTGATGAGPGALKVFIKKGCVDDVRI